MRAPLTRDNVAELVYNTLFAQMVAFNDYRGQYVKNTNRDVVVTAGTDDEANTLAYNTFKLYVVEGIVMANGYTDKALAQSSTNNSQTTVMFTEDTDLDKDGRKEYDEGEEFDFNAGPSLDLIGHAVKVYYTIEKKSPVVYAITDQAALTAVIEYDKNTTRLAEAANAAGFKKNTILDVKLDDYKVNYDMDVTLKDVQGTNWVDGSTIYTASNYDLNNLQGKKLLLISNSGNLDLSGEYDYVIVLDQFLTVVSEVEEIRGEIEYALKSNNSTHAQDGTLAIPLYSDVTEDDYVVATNIGLQDEVVVFYEATLVDATITRITGISDSHASAKRITADGVVYIESSVWGNADNSNNALVDLLTKFVDVADLEEETLVLDEFGEMVGITEVEKTYDYAYIAELVQNGVVHSTGSLNTVNRLTAHVFFADGTNGVYEVHSCPVQIYGGTDPISGITYSAKKIASGQESPPLFSLDSGNGYGIPAGFDPTDGTKAGPALGIWDVNLRSDGRIEISLPHNQEETRVGTTKAALKDVRLIQNHSTFVYKNNVAVEGEDETATPSYAGSTFNSFDHEDRHAGLNDNYLYQNNNTVYFYVNGNGTGTSSNNYSTTARTYDDDKLDVVVRVGIKNAFSFKNDDDDRGEGIKEVIASQSGTRTVVNAVLVEGVEMYDSDLYYYNPGNYHMTSEGLVYELYDLNGNLVEKTYKDLDKDDARSKWDGFYLAKANDIVPYNIETVYFGSPTWKDGANTWAWSNTSDGVTETIKGKAYYVVNDTAEYDEYVENFFGTRTPQGNISDSVKIVDACNSGLNTVSKLVRAIKDIQAVGGDHSNLLISYTYNTDDYVLKTIFVSKYDPDATDAPNVNQNAKFEAEGWLSREKDANGIYKLKADVDIINKGSSTIAASDVAAGKVSVTFSVQQLSGGSWIDVVSNNKQTTTTNMAAITAAGTPADSGSVTDELASRGLFKNITAENGATFRVTFSVTIKGIGTAENYAIITY